jgi:hypothetical protein
MSQRVTSMQYTLGTISVSGAEQYKLVICADGQHLDVKPFTNEEINPTEIPPTLKSVSFHVFDAEAKDYIPTHPLAKPLMERFLKFELTPFDEERYRLSIPALRFDGWLVYDDASPHEKPTFKLCVWDSEKANYHTVDHFYVTSHSQGSAKVDLMMSPKAQQQELTTVQQQTLEPHVSRGLHFALKMLT